ncbi:DAK2 domain-containing protein [Salinarimonas sp. NSM]|uniref:DAK2 domain-containing protein n=1 Tax=Salinarimonas sp. NSM TaxID=3458003 RepID=UPI0040362A6D
MNIAPATLAAFVRRMRAAADAVEQRLNAADARLGDGDTGSMLRRIARAMDESGAGEAADLGAAATILAQAAARETGSSLGTLVATGLISLAKEARARDGAIDARDLAVIVSRARDAMAARGRAERGDKTVLDSLDAIARALDEEGPGRGAAARAAREALATFRDRPCRVGRARMFPDRSTGSDDPGMLAVALLLEHEEPPHVA